MDYLLDRFYYSEHNAKKIIQIGQQLFELLKIIIFYTKGSNPIFSKGDNNVKLDVSQP